MNVIKSKISSNKLQVDYEPTFNLIEISISEDDNSFLFVQLDEAKTEHLIELLTEFKNHIK